MNKKELQKIWDKAVVPKPGALKGEYKVKMLYSDMSKESLSSFILLSMNIFGDRKMFRINSDIGFNILGKNKKWGWFFLEEYPEKFIINYNRKKNGKTVRTIRDHIRYVPEHEYYIGKFNMVINGKLRFLGWFTLTKIKEGVKDEKNNDNDNDNVIVAALL